MHRLLVLAMAVIPVMWLAAPATAEARTLQVNPHTVAAGGTVRVSGSGCEAPHTNGYAISPAFVDDHGSHDFAGVGAVQFVTNNGAFSVTAQVSAGTVPGKYLVTARCGGGNLGVSATLTVTAAAGSAPTAVPAGSGGLAATDRTSQPRLLLLGGAGLLLLVAGGALLPARRRQRPVD